MRVSPAAADEGGVEDEVVAAGSGTDVTEVLEVVSWTVEVVDPVVEVIEVSVVDGVEVVVVAAARRSWMSLAARGAGRSSVT